MLELHHRHAAELAHQAASLRQAREAGAGRVRRFGRWPRRRPACGVAPA